MKYFKLILLVVIIFCISSVQIINAQDYKYGSGATSIESYNEHLKKQSRSRTFSNDDLPNSYDARSENIVTEAKNQGGYGYCWAFATAGALESKILMTSGIEYDLSEQQLINGCNNVWNYNGSASIYWRDKGPKQESCFPYGSSEDSCNELGFRIYNWHTVPRNTNDFKVSLYEDGPSYWQFDVYSDFYEFWKKASSGDSYIQSDENFQNCHAVLIIGWDDDKEAYLCKNSWGTGGPNGDGTFWISYSDHTNDLRFEMSNFSITELDIFPEQGCFISVL